MSLFSNSFEYTRNNVDRQCIFFPFLYCTNASLATITTISFKKTFQNKNNLTTIDYITTKTEGVLGRKDFSFTLSANFMI